MAQLVLEMGDAEAVVHGARGGRTGPAGRGVPCGVGKAGGDGTLAGKLGRRLMAVALAERLWLGDHINDGQTAVRSRWAGGRPEAGRRTSEKGPAPGSELVIAS